MTTMMSKVVMMNNLRVGYCATRSAPVYWCSILETVPFRAGYSLCNWFNKILARILNLAIAYSFL